MLRRKPLKSKTALKSNRKPISRKSAKKKTKEKMHKPVREYVLKVRSRGNCEGCGKPSDLEWAHLFGRGNQISEPLCSTEEATCALCRSCHVSIDTYEDIAKRLRLQWVAVARMSKKTGVMPFPFGTGNPLDYMKWYERYLSGKVGKDDAYYVSEEK